MKIPVVQGVIDRRILVNYRVDPDVVARLLPAPFRPKLVGGYAVAGICLIRLKHVRPRFLPAIAGLSSENAAHRIAVEWDSEGSPREGVFIPRRDTSSRFNTLAGGRLFPGVHHHARFQVREQLHRYEVQVDSDDGQVHVAVAGSMAPELPPGSVFGSVRTASNFFECGSLGYSPTHRPETYDGLELCATGWHVDALAVDKVESSFFENEQSFPSGSAQFDCALVMRGIVHEWHARPALCAPGMA
jgi:hypothetical protein